MIASEEGASMRTLDPALWAWSKANGAATSY